MMPYNTGGEFDIDGFRADLAHLDTVAILEKSLYRHGTLKRIFSGLEMEDFTIMKCSMCHSPGNGMHKNR